MHHQRWHLGFLATLENPTRVEFIKTNTFGLWDLVNARKTKLERDLSENLVLKNNAEYPYIELQKLTRKLEKNIIALKELSETAMRPTGKFEQVSEIAYIDSCGLYLGYNRCSCGSVCNGAGGSYISYVNQPILEPDFERRKDAAKKLIDAEKAYEAHCNDPKNKQNKQKLEKLINFYLDKEKSLEQQIKNAKSVLNDIEKLLIATEYESLISILSRRLPRTYIYLDENEKIVFLDTLASIFTNIESFDSFVKGVSKLSPADAESILLHLYATNYIGWEENSDIRIKYMSLLLKSGICNALPESFCNAIRADIANYEIRKIIVEEIERLSGFFITLLMSSTNVRINILEQLHKLISDNTYRKTEMKNAPCSTYQDIFTFWKKRTTPIDLIESTNETILANELNPVKRFFNVDKPTVTKGIIDKIESDYGNIALCRLTF